MTSDYQKWIARNEVREEKRELTPREKCANWWHYNWWIVLVAVLAALFLAKVSADFLTQREKHPDCRIAYLGTAPLPEDTVTALEQQLAPLIGDLNGDGRVNVLITQYVLADDPHRFVARDITSQEAMHTRLSANENYLYILQDPEFFQANYPLLAFADGVYPREEPQRQEALWYRWSDCPTLAQLPLGTYAQEGGQPGQSQSLLQDLYVARGYVRGSSKEERAKHQEIWQSLIAGNPG